MEIPNYIALESKVGDFIVDNKCVLPNTFWQSFPCIAADIKEATIAEGSTDVVRWRHCLEGTPKTSDYYDHIWPRRATVNWGEKIWRSSIKEIGDCLEGYSRLLGIQQLILSASNCKMRKQVYNLSIAGVLLGTDSHTCTAGAFGQFATGIGNTDAGFVLGTGKLLLKVPPTLRFVMDGEMPDYIMAKDLILQIIGEISVAGATYKAMEFVGTTVESLSNRTSIALIIFPGQMEERMTLCNMVVEAGGKNGVVPADSTTYKYLEDKTSKPYEPVYSDAQARYLSEYRFDISKLEPLVAKPHSPDNRALARECKDVKIDRVYIGSCTGGKTEDFVAAAKLFLASGKKVKVPTFLVPATQKVWVDVYSLPVPGSGGKTCSQIFEEAGCDTPASPSCGACLGGPKDTYARMRVDNQPKLPRPNGTQGRPDISCFPLHSSSICIDWLCY
ncbi:hypothetical protein TIFTF001_022448 [Ficus carica]|uniref:Aconitase/3-isopropylmalate dehydratase large subunit alpha/beta/alpha domain-containing protein n=1 Tax=Ficus carica TaxID=3494 RepID=A0AA88DFI9_FICCA|nr:hypothetical protein TIFTF001_022448 [Ficus carica]